MPTYYEVLDVHEDAKPEDIRHSYRTLALRWHPDNNAGDRAAEENFKTISIAYSVLSNPVSRSEYDDRIHGGTMFASTLNNAEANNIFTQEMLEFAAELTIMNLSHRKIATYLVKAGCPERIALQIALETEKERKRIVKAQVRHLLPKQFLKMGISLAVGLLGIRLHFISFLQTVGYAVAGIAGFFFVYFLIQLLRILYLGITGKSA